MSNSIWLSWGEVFNYSLQGLWMGFIGFVPKLILAILLFIIGWVLGNIIAKAIEQIFSSLKIDRFFSSIGVDNFFRKAGMNLNSGYFLGQIVKWFMVIVFLLPSLELVGLGGIKDFLQNSVLVFLPRVVVAALVLIIASFLSEGISKTITAATRNMNLASAHMLGTIAKYSVWIFAFIMALGQLGIADYYMNVIFTGIIAMLSIGGALAFGLGGRDAAAKFIEKLSLL